MRKQLLVGLLLLPATLQPLFAEKLITDSHPTEFGLEVQQSKKITGTVVDAAGIPVIGANILVKGTTNGTITDIDGNFSIEVEENSILEVSYIGYVTTEVKVGANTTLSITLKEDSQALDELVVTALGIKREEKALGYSVQKVSGEDLSVVKGVNVASSLTGKISGLQINNSSEISESPELKLT